MKELQTNPKTTAAGKLFWLSYFTLLVWSILLLVVNNQVDMDLWGVMSFGALLDQNPGHFPFFDPFAYTAHGAPWIYHEWGSGVVFYQFFKYGGSAALFWLKFLLVEVMLVLSCHLYLLGGLRKRSQPINSIGEAIYAACLPLTLYLLFPNVSSTLRCQLFSFVGFALSLFILKRHSQGRLKYAIWLLPLLMLLWTNLHGGFILGLGLIGLYLLYHWFSGHRHESESLAVVLVLSLLSTMINPYGLRFWETMLSAWTLPREHISEWGNVMTMLLPFSGILYTALLLFSLLLGIAKWRRMKAFFPLTFLLMLFTGGYGWLHYKLSPLFLIAFLSHGLDTLPEDLATIQSWLPATMSKGVQLLRKVFSVLTVWGLSFLLVLGVLLNVIFYEDSLAVRVPSLTASQSGTQAPGITYPLGIARFILQHNIRGNLWVPFTWGEFLYWVLYPQCKVSIDGRYETLYSAENFNAYHRFYHPPYPIGEAERYHTQFIVAEASTPALLDKLRRTARWHEIYRDPQASLFSREPGPLTVDLEAHQAVTLDNVRGDLSRFKILNMP